MRSEQQLQQLLADPDLVTIIDVITKEVASRSGLAKQLARAVVLSAIGEPAALSCIHEAWLAAKTHGEPPRLARLIIRRRVIDLLRKDARPTGHCSLPAITPMATDSEAVQWFDEALKLDPRTQLELRQLAAMVRGALACFAEQGRVQRRQAQLLQRRVLDGVSYAVLSDELTCSENALRVRVRKATMALRRHVAGCHQELQDLVGTETAPAMRRDVQPGMQDLRATRRHPPQGDPRVRDRSPLHAAEHRRARAPSRGAPQRTILFVAANPCGSDLLRLGEECAEIQRELKMTSHRDHFRFESRWAVGVDELMRHLTELDPTVLHVSGHGDTAGLLLQDERGRLEPVSARALAMMVHAAARNVRVIVLNACYSMRQANELRAKIECVVGIDGAIGDDAARAFAVRFYGALGSRRSIGNAVEQGVASLAAKRLPEAVLPRCLTKVGVDPHKIVLAR